MNVGRQWQCTKCGGTAWTSGKDRKGNPNHLCAACGIPMPKPETAAEITSPSTDVDVDVDAPPAPCPHPEHRLGTRGGLRKHQRVCLQCGAVVLARR